MSHYDCEHGNYAGLGCSLCDAESQARKEALLRRQASRVTSWYAVYDWGRQKIIAHNEAEAVRIALQPIENGSRCKLLRVTKTVTETIWTPT